MSARYLARLGKMEQKDLLPVILGGDVGAYAIALEFREAYGCESLFVSHSPADVVTRSDFASVEHIPAGVTDAELLAVLTGIAAVHRDKRLILMANTDARAEFAARFKDQLQADYVVPFPDLDVMQTLCRKDEFAEACAAAGARTPAQVVIDLAGAESPEIPFEFPVVAKTASGSAYDKVDFPGKKKIYFIDEPAELDALWDSLRAAGYTDKFLVQERIPGADWQMLSLTMYVDSHGDVTLAAGARVLLEDHAPAMVGNPVAMITGAYPEFIAQAAAILNGAGYRGFANFDLKTDPRDGQTVFFEVNPRIGRNSYYVAAAGVNPMEIMVRDLVEGERVEPVTVETEVLYSLVPTKLISKYVDDEELLAAVDRLVEAGEVYSPLESPLESDLQRRITVKLQKLNYFRKFKKFFPAVKEGGGDA